MSEATVTKRDGFVEVTHDGEQSDSVFSSDDGAWHLAHFLISERPRLVLTNGARVAVFSHAGVTLHSAISNAGAAAVTIGEGQPSGLHALLNDGQRAELNGIDFGRFSFAQFPHNDLTLEVVYRDDSRETVDLAPYLSSSTTI